MTVTYTFTTEDFTALLTATPTDYTKIQVGFSTFVVTIGSGAANSAINPSNYTIVGGTRELTVLDAVAIDSMTIELTVPEMQNGAAYEVFAAGTIESLNGFSISSSLLTDPTADSAPFVGLGQLPRLISATVASPGILHADFSEAIVRDARSLAIGSYQVTALDGGGPVIITGVTIDVSMLTRAVLSFTGGSGLYELVVSGQVDPAGNFIDPNHNSAVFETVVAVVDELFEEKAVYFDTDLGAIRLVTSELSQRRIEDLVIKRAQNVGHSEQLKSIANALERAGVDRSGRLNLFKG